MIAEAATVLDHLPLGQAIVHLQGRVNHHLAMRGPAGHIALSIIPEIIKTSLDLIRQPEDG